MEDEDTCRICRSGPEPGSPLYYPCKCTGSIRYCHQDCLVEWLQHSRKKYCELCNHPFIFHKKYRSDMPADGKLPRYLYVRHLIIRAGQLTQLTARALLVGFIWLALLPWININVWRFMLWSIDVATWMGVPGSEPPFDLNAPPASNATSSVAAYNSTAPVQSSVKFSASFSRTRNGTVFQAGTLGRIPITTEAIKSAVHAFVKKLANDCFHGQILSCVIVIFFVGVFLLREWILQNIPQNFDVQPNLDGVPAVQQPADPAAPVQPQQAGQDQLRAIFEQRREQIEQLLARLPEFEDDLQQPIAPPDHDAQPQGDAHELDLDPETQRQRARQARMRRLQQAVAGLDEPADGVDSTTSQVTDEAAQDPEEEGNQGPQPEAQPSSSQDLQQRLGWSVQESQFDNPEDQHAATYSDQEHAGPSISRSGSALQTQPEASSSSQPDAATSSTASAIPAEPEQNQTEPEDAPAESTESHQQATTTAVAPPAPTPADQQDDENQTVQAGNDEEAADDNQEAWEDESDDANAGAGAGPEAEAGAAHQAALRAAAAAAFPPPIAAHMDDEIEIGVAAAADPDDPEAEIGLAEEMDGILEAIGMRGPLFGIVQNLFLMIFLCAFVMLAFVMVPYIVGRALGSGPGLIRLLALPVKLLRYVTDPVFDALIALGANKVWPTIAKAVGMGATQVSDKASPLASTAAGGAVGGWMQKVLPSLVSSTATNSTKAVSQQTEASRMSTTAAMLVRLLPTTITTSSQWKAVSDSFDIALATGLQGTLERALESIASIFTKLDEHRIGNTSTDRAYCVAFGHAYWLLVLFVHSRVSAPDLSRPSSALKSFIDQHVLIIKAISFIFIELFVFPFGCGLLLDICTMPFLEHASLLAWPAKARTTPISFAFTRWMGGTIYMFVFAQYVSATRKILRPGVLCWIRDPNDPNFHPIREILDKKSWTQLRKIGASAVMYAAILVASVGVNTYFLRYAVRWAGVLPLRWKPFEPLTEVPVDLVLVHFALPWATQRVDPDKISEKWLSAWWKTASRALRLSTYMIGGEFKEEQRTVKGQSAIAATWNALLGRKVEDDGEEDLVEDGGLCRVPGDDKAITSGPLIIPLNPDGSATTERMEEAIAAQEKDALKHTPKPTYTNLYLPSRYRTRITILLTTLWLSHCALFCLGLSIPLLLGRFVVRREVHDVYAFAVGLILIMVVGRVVGTVRKMWMRRVRRAKFYRTTPGKYMVVHTAVKVKRVLKAVLLLVGLGGVVPMTVGLLVESYVLVPLRYRSSELPVVDLGQTWALGLIETRLALFTVRFVGIPPTGAVSRFMSNVDHVLRGGLYPRPRVVIAWKRIVLPILLAGVTLLLGPVLIADALIEFNVVHASTRAAEQVVLRKVFGAIQSTMLVLAVRAVVRRRMESWTDLLKDEVFLESTELKNYAEEADAAEDGVGAFEAQGTLPDVLFR